MRLPRARRFLDRFQQRLVRARPGSVLVLVIALLVLLALIGTAYISTTRIDRAAAAQNSTNAEIDLLVQGVGQMVQGMLVNAVAPGGNFRQANTSYLTYDHPLTSTWLSDRVPSPVDITKPVDMSTDPPLNGAVWRYVSAPPTGSFESPQNGTNYSARTYMLPTYVTLADSTGQTAAYPALKYYDPATAAWSGPYLAADSDGDGVADAPLFRLPIGQIGGVTYYAGFRVIDNLAAFNASVAWQANSSASFAGNNFFPTNIDLFHFSNYANPDMDNYNSAYRFNNGSTVPNLTPINDAGSIRNDFSFLTPEEALWYQLGRRLQYPGNNGPDSNSVMKRYQSLSMGDSISMARRFTLRDATGSPSTLEQYFPSEVYSPPAPVRSQPYAPTALTAAQYLATTSSWFNDNFDYTAGPLCLRSMFVGRNPVSNFVPSKFACKGDWGPGVGCTFGDWVQYNGRPYVAIVDSNAGMYAPITVSQTPSTATDPVTGCYKDTQYWAAEAWSSAPVKTSVNTGTFNELRLAYWSVISDSKDSPAAVTVNGDAKTSQGKMMFRSSVRNPAELTMSMVPAPTVPGLSCFQQVLLRSAIAAANTMSLRGSATSEDVSILNYSLWTPYPGSSEGHYASQQYIVTLYGNAPQPYITEAYANNDPTIGDVPNGYIAVELHNPYPFAFPLKNWKLATIARKGTGAGLTVVPIPPTTVDWSNATTAPSIPAGGYIVIANTATPARYSTFPTATAANGTLYVEPNLKQAFDNELVLLRPDEGPADSYDFTGLAAPGGLAAADNAYEWKYTRPNASSATPASQAWHFVYPGKLDPTQGNDGDHPRLTQTTHTSIPPATRGGIPHDSLASLGNADATGSYTGVPLQVFNMDCPGPNRVGAAGNTFPFGQFARNGDILQVPFIGAYKIMDAGNDKIIEMNAITMDGAMAAVTDDDSPAGNLAPPTQDIGRFVPASGTNAYDWTARLFDYLTVQAPHDDYLPDADPIHYAAVAGASNTPEGVANMKSSVVNAVVTPSNTTTEDTAPIDGLININTAPWRLLFALPMVDTANINAELAKAIVYYRDVDDGTGFPPAWVSGQNYSPGDKVSYGGATYNCAFANAAWAANAPPGSDWAATAYTPHPHGPFKTIWDLNQVAFNQPGGLNIPTLNGGKPIAFKTNFSRFDGSTPALTYDPATSVPLNTDGDLSPMSVTSPQTVFDNVFNDFEKRNLALTRISNLITTRSDSFTVYLTVQGWKKAGTANPQLVVQRRAAFIVDRSGMTPKNLSLAVTNVPTN